MRPRLVLFDFDGVFRHHDPRHEAEAAAALGLRPGDLAEVAFDPALMEPMVRGQRTRAEWVAAVIDRAAERLDGARSEQSHRGAGADHVAVAIEPWLADWGWVDDAVVEIAHDLRARGIDIAMLTNGTDTVEEELAAHGLTELIAPLFNTWRIGWAKPDPEIYAHICRELDRDPGDIVFFDDSPTNVNAARRVGLHAVHFVSADQTRVVLKDLGLLE